MGRRAKKAPVQTKKRATLAKRFKCPFCANEDVVECKMDYRKSGVGSLECRLCGANFQMPIHHLHEPIDVFSEWLDACEAAQHGRKPNQEEPPPEEEEDDDLPESSGLIGRPTPAAAASSKKPAAKEQQPSYSALGLDDSEDDSDDD
uniref:Transcription elongation factor 1 homolog n=1 Tax=Grammatophora oceanica TaxID=210454 RepID=A0A7S1Y6W7_9STRA|mmetsp:Transcript_31775/g.47227  ORF Transcript_31775/g.47227 Transcript_31775/m.47227 type:complete len:147 (+) Transcript_31775:124-564(+)|eukprot:CAMPEP_0194048218 /NCGR_PEP_ID=MMETSP0009_2-20130614/26794_1 /TAXON_ID=210454 /ORGANISM="Grammatophora oceanica, Strain CCMP 410" /LENGTH=146 /DNA_ID=CAMNT_0038694037 /DNA_START=124 /DNA_END=564 /DNA_ORIENTATION=-